MPKNLKKVFPPSSYGMSLATSLYLHSYAINDLGIVCYVLKCVKALNSFTLHLYQEDGPKRGCTSSLYQRARIQPHLNVSTLTEFGDAPAEQDKLPDSYDI
jgi:hypothetical protein